MLDPLLLITSLLAGMLTVLAPCVLPLLPVMLGGSLGQRDWRRPVVIAASLAASVVAFTLLLKASTALIGVPPETWKIISGGIVLLFGLSLVWPEGWDWLANKIGFARRSEHALARAGGDKSLAGAALLGAALGPVFSSCSPTYFVIIATVLPVSFAAGIGYLLVYAAGLMLVLAAIGLFGQAATKKLRWAANPRGTFKRILGVLLLAVALAILTGVDKKIETAIIDAGFGTTRLEESLIDRVGMPSQPQASPESASLPDLGAAPELAGLTNWINSEPIDSLAELRGKVVLVDFWTYSCINCIRTLPYLESWHEKYAADGLVILGIHAPEFQFERVPENVQKAVQDAGLSYPIAQDNDFKTWKNYNNRYWPAKYLIDRDGQIRYRHFGEGEYAETEAAIAELLGSEMKTGAVTAVAPEFGKIATPETYLGTGRRANFVPDAVDLALNEWTLGGSWAESRESIQTAQPGASLRMRFSASQANLVLGGSGTVRVLIDGQPANDSNRGRDLDASGQLQITGERLYELANFGGEYGEHEIELRFDAPGSQAFAWTFG